MRIYALLTVSGTAMAESGVCENHIDAPGVTDRARLAADYSGDWDFTDFVEVTGNTEIHCLWCGRP